MKEALKLALESLEWFTAAEQGDEPPINKAITAIKDALAQPEQEPVAHFGSAYVNANGVHITTVLGPVAIPQDAKLYTSPPPQRKLLTPEQEQVLSKCKPENQKKLRQWIADGTFIERALGTIWEQERALSNQPQPEQEPLRGEQFVQIARAIAPRTVMGLKETIPNWVVEYGRAIEAAHGIKGEA